MAGPAADPHAANLTFSAGSGGSEMMAFQQNAQRINASSTMQTGRPQETHTTTAWAVDGSVMPIQTVQPETASQFVFGVSDGLDVDDDAPFDDRAGLEMTPESPYRG